MFSVILIIAGFKAGCPILTIFFVVFFWVCVLCSNPLRKTNTTHYIDKYGDENYGDINWLRNKKL